MTNGEEIQAVVTGMAEEFGGPIPVGPSAVIGGDSMVGASSRLFAGTDRAEVMRNHGPFSLGVTMKNAVKAAVMHEDVARMVHIAMQGGRLIPTPQDRVDCLCARYQKVYGQSGEDRR